MIEQAVISFVVAAAIFAVVVAILWLIAAGGTLNAAENAPSSKFLAALALISLAVATTVVLAYYYANYVMEV